MLRDLLPVLTVLIALAFSCFAGLANAQISLDTVLKPFLDRYALGCGELPVGWAPEPLLYHGGSNQMNLAHVWLDTKRDFAMVIATNIGGDKADQALFGLAPALYSKFCRSTRTGDQ